MSRQPNSHQQEDLAYPVEIVLAPSWWHKHAGMSFDESFFYHPIRRVECEQKMEQVLYDRWGRFGLGKDKDTALPQVGAVHLAAGFLVSEMLGCRVDYKEDAPPQVIPASRDTLELDVDAAFSSQAYKRFAELVECLKKRHGCVVGDVNWGGVLNLALDLHGQTTFVDMFDKPDQVRDFFKKLQTVIERFTMSIQSQTATSSISVNRTVAHLSRPVFLHSECSHTMISAEDYRKYLMPIDADWSRRVRPYGIHHCGPDADRFAQCYAELPHLDFLDVGWGSNVKKLRQHLPNTFLNLRLSPVEILQQTQRQIHDTICKLAADSGDPYRTGICCINMDADVEDSKITAIFETVAELRRHRHNVPGT
ncbi:MAG: hypothetical protein LLF76_01980 [Planctomycetaceae bacterium]|nr:hypothetical protein [Planctomycetaceae bacterium]